MKFNDNLEKLILQKNFYLHGTVLALKGEKTKYLQ